MKKKIISALAAITAVSVCFCGCGNTREGYSANDTRIVGTASQKGNELIIVAGIGSNTGGYDTSELYEDLYDLSFDAGRLTYIIADSTPKADISQSVEVKDDNPSETSKKRRATSNAKKLAGMIDEAAPDSEECDLLGAVSVASKAASQANAGDIMVFSNLLSTSGYIDMTKLVGSVEDIDVGKTVDDLLSKKAIPDLTGITVRWTVLSAVNEQSKLTPLATERLEQLWREIIEAGGGKVEFTESLSAAVNQTTWQKVTPVEVGSDENSLHEAQPIEQFNEEQAENVGNEETPAAEIPDDKAIDIPESSIGFKPDTAELVDRNKAIEVLKPVSEILIASGKKVTLIGSTAAYGNPESARKLSLKRSQAIAKILTDELGVPEKNITCIGSGYDSSNPFFDSSSDKANRKTVLTSSDNALIKSVGGIRG